MAFQETLHQQISFDKTSTEMHASSTKKSTDKSSNPKTSLESSRLLENARDVPCSSDGVVSSGSPPCPETTNKRHTRNAASRTAKKPKLLAETQPQDPLPKRQHAKILESSKSQTLPMKKASSLTAGNLNKRQNMPKQSRRKRPLSTEVSLSSTSPADLRCQTGKPLRGTSLRHSWHGMPAVSRSDQSRQRQQKGKTAKKGK